MTHDDTADTYALFAHYLLHARPQAQRVRVGVLFKPGSFWVGVHWSKRNRRICLNLVPMVTIWIALRGGYTPAEGDAPIRKVGKAPELAAGFGPIDYPGAPS